MYFKEARFQGGCQEKYRERGNSNSLVFNRFVPLSYICINANLSLTFEICFLKNVHLHSSTILLWLRGGCIYYSFKTGGLQWGEPTQIPHNRHHAQMYISGWSVVGLHMMTHPQHNVTHVGPPHRCSWPSWRARGSTTPWRPWRRTWCWWTTTWSAPWWRGGCCPWPGSTPSSPTSTAPSRPRCHVTYINYNGSLSIITMIVIIIHYNNNYNINSYIIINKYEK